MSSNVPAATSWRVRKYGRQNNTGWTTFREQTGPICLLLQPEMGYVLVLQNATVLESVPLSLYPGTVQIHVDGDMLMFVFTDKAKKPVRRFRLLFAQEQESEENPRKPSRDCVEALRKYFTIYETSNRASSASIEETTLAEAFESIVTSKNSNALSLGRIFTKTSPAGPPLDNLVRLCLLDPTFPSLVGSVQNIVKSLTDPTEK